MNVVVEGEHSDSAYVESGVPQGTVLGPLMFLCHINDLPDCVKSQVRLFADDCLIYRQIKTQKDHQILQNDLKELENWASKWGMRFNAKKYYILSIQQKSSHFYQLDNEILQQVDSNLVYKFKKLIGSNDFSFQFRKIITRYRRIGYNLNVMRQSACLVFNPITVDNYAAFFNCTPVGRASDSMMAPT